MSQDQTVSRGPVSADGPGPISDAIVRIARCHRMIAGQLLRRLGLYPGQELLLMRLWETGPQRQTELVRALGLDASTLTRMVQRLEQAGFVRRAPDPDDGRAVVVSPTPASQALRDQVMAAWADLETVTLAELDDAGRAALGELLAAVERGLCRAADRPGTAG